MTPFSTVLVLVVSYLGLAVVHRLGPPKDA